MFLAFAYHAISVLAAAVVLYPLLGIRLSPIVAATAIVLSSLSVVSNANRLRRFTSLRIGLPTGGDDGATVTGPAPRSAAPSVRP